MSTDLQSTPAEGHYRMMRANPRYSFFADADVTLRDATSVPAQLEQLSSGGCYIDTLEPIPIRTKLRLRIHDGMSSCELHGQVIYMHSGGGLGIFGIGVRFEEIGSEQHSTINTWLRSLAKSPRKTNNVLA
jgi:PilZ domain